MKHKKKNQEEKLFQMTIEGQPVERYRTMTQKEADEFNFQLCNANGGLWYQWELSEDINE